MLVNFLSITKMVTNTRFDCKHQLFKMQTRIVFKECYSGVWLSFYYIRPFEIGLLWAMITYFKSYFMALNFWLQENMK